MAIHTPRAVSCPQIMQMEALECGAASLAMVMAYHGKWVALEQVRADCGVSRDGSLAVNMVKAGRAYGFVSRGLRMEVEGLKNAALPCIIHWNFNHFVVFRGFKGNRALINDPARGAVEIPLEEFSRSFTGIVLTFEKGEGFVPGGKRRGIMNFARSRLKGMFIPFIFILLTGIIGALTGIVNPVFSQIFMDRILGGTSPGWLYGLLAAMLGISLIQLVVRLFLSLYLLKIEGKFAVTANSQFLWHILRLPMEFFAQRMAGDLALRQRSNQGIAATLLQVMAPQILNLFMLIFYLLVMIRYSLLLTLVGLVSVSLNIIFARLISNKRISLSRPLARDMGRLAGSTVAGIDMIETLKASGAENGFFERWAGYQASANASLVRYIKTGELMGNIPSLLQKFSEILLLVFGVYLIMQGRFTTGMLLAFQGFMISFMEPVSSLVTAGQHIQEMRTDMERLEDVFEYPQEKRLAIHTTNADSPAQKSYQKLKGALSMKDVSFGYSKLAPPLIEHFNLELKPGASIALVGSSGCGKSTIAKLISGLYQPWSGEIQFDGIAIGELPREVITGSLGVVDQDIVIFEDTIANNIKVWDKSIEDFEMILAAKDAKIHEDVMLRENGYNYAMSEGGRDFSGGQRQRFEIARVLAQDPTIVILDEATSALDAKTEQEVAAAIKGRDITTILVAHRLSTIRDCDEIIVLDKGKVVERGTHEELLEREGFYKQLITTE
ncbi:NHLP family bacteriocin export ABC transporter peptidase/permease/ATPase [Spirochaetia bacterium]|nr:NHLP family bacteriocin export ABC transporter peptidase/permease/ATPase [Spirochaetia bacterium]